MSEKKQHPLSALLAQLVGQTNVIVVHTHMIKLLDNDHLAALFFEQLCYWSERSKEAGKWVAKTDADWFDELYLGKKQLIRIRSVLTARDLIETDVRRSKHYGGQPVLHYRVIQDGLEALLTGIPRSAKTELPMEKPKGNSYESAETDTSYTETLQETLQEKKPVAPKSRATDSLSSTDDPDYDAWAEGIKNTPVPAPQPRRKLTFQDNPDVDRLKEQNGTVIVETPEPTDFDLLVKAVELTLKQYGAAAEVYAKMLMGMACKKGFNEYRMDDPVSATELQDWAMWYQRSNPGMNLKTTPMKLQSSILEWRAQKSTPVHNSPPVIAEDVANTDAEAAPVLLAILKGGR